MSDTLVTDKNSARTPSEFKVNYIRLYSQNLDEAVDITKMVNYIEIFESIYSPFMTLNININDAISLNNLLPLIGEEYVEVDIRGADDVTGLINQAFAIYRMSNRTEISNKTFAYTLQCISPGALIDMNLNISQAFAGQPSDIVGDKIFKHSMGISKSIYSHPTKNVVSYISNYWSPVQNIKYLCDRAVSRDSTAASYVFYETKKSFVFAPLDYLVGQPSSWEYFYVDNTHTTGIDNEQKIIHNLYIDETFNYINRIMSGAYGNRSLTVDANTKRYQYNYYDFLQSFDKYSRLNEQSFGTDNATRKINAMFRVRYYSSKTISTMQDEYVHEWFRQRVTELASMNSQNIFVDTAGRFNVYVGNVVNVVIPTSTMPTKASDPKDMNRLMDRTLSGRYLVTGIKHMLDRERHTLSLQLSKDSMIKLPGGSLGSYN